LGLLGTSLVAASLLSGAMLDANLSPLDRAGTALVAASLHNSAMPLAKTSPPLDKLGASVMAAKTSPHYFPRMAISIEEDYNSLFLFFSGERNVVARASRCKLAICEM
jgi:hypothetical protein